MKKLCSIPDCGKPYVANGYCAAHNAKFKKYGDPLAKRNRWDGHVKEVKTCCVKGCDNQVVKGRMCSMHRQRKSRHGDVSIVKSKGNKEIWKLAHGGGSKIKYTHDLSIFDKWTPELAWLLGWTITDGCVENTKRNVVSWMLKDREPLEIIQRLFKTEKPIRDAYKINKKTGERRQYYRLRLCGNKIVNKFIEFGIEPRKTFITKLPPMPDEFIWHFLRGVIEGDGYIYLHTNKPTNRKGYIGLVVGITSGNCQFLEDIKNKTDLGKIRFNDSPGHSSYVLEIHCSEAVKFLDAIYANSEKLKLNRKYDKWLRFLESGQKYK